MKYYVLKENGDFYPVESDTTEWHKSFANNSIAKDEVKGISISTIFLGFDHSWGGGEPILFETMIFGGENDMYQERYHTKQEALIGHKNAIKLVKKNN